MALCTEPSTRFLVVDDSSTMRRIIINTLNQLGHSEIVEASNGREGIDRLNAADVDMVITDWNMPEMNGIEFIRALTRAGRPPCAPTFRCAA